MRKLLSVLAILMFCAIPAFAMPGKTELAFSGSYVNPKEGAAVWNLGAEVLFPLGSGIIILGPAVTMSDDDIHTGGGATLEVNIPGQSGGFFFGGSAIYYLDSEEGQDDYGAGARAGVKLPISKSGLIKVYLQQGLTGRDRDADLIGALGAVIKF